MRYKKTALRNKYEFVDKLLLSSVSGKSQSLTYFALSIFYVQAQTDLQPEQRPSFKNSSASNIIEIYLALGKYRSRICPYFICNATVAHQFHSHPRCSARTAAISIKKIVVAPHLTASLVWFC